MSYKGKRSNTEKENTRNGMLKFLRNAGRRVLRKCELCGNEFEKSISYIKSNPSRFCSKKCYWVNLKNSLIGKNNPFFGKRHTEETRIKISKNQGGTGEFVFNDKRKIKKSLEYRLWRKSVFERDNCICIWCGSKENLEADHIKPFALFPALRFAIDNGRTLCHGCHLKTDTYGNKNGRI